MTQAETTTQRGGSRGDRFGVSGTAHDVTPGCSVPQESSSTSRFPIPTSRGSRPLSPACDARLAILVRGDRTRVCALVASPEAGIDASGEEEIGRAHV